MRSNGFHFAALFSVFTHFYAADIQRYLNELRRVMRPGGTVLATFFLYTDDTVDAAVATSAYPMAHRLDEHTIYNDAADPLRAIAFHERAVREMVAASGLEISKIERGQWNGAPGPHFQDIVVLRRPAAPVAPVDRRAPVRVRRLLGRVRRRLRSSVSRD